MITFYLSLEIDADRKVCLQDSSGRYVRIEDIPMGGSVELPREESTVLGLNILQIQRGDGISASLVEPSQAENNDRIEWSEGTTLGVAVSGPDTQQTPITLWLEQDPGQTRAKATIDKITKVTIQTSDPSDSGPVKGDPAFLRFLQGFVPELLALLFEARAKLGAAGIELSPKAAKTLGMVLRHPHVREHAKQADIELELDVATTSSGRGAAHKPGKANK